MKAVCYIPATDKLPYGSYVDLIFVRKSCKELGVPLKVALTAIKENELRLDMDEAELHSFIKMINNE